MCSGNCENNSKMIMENQQVIYNKMKEMDTKIDFIVDYLDKLAPVINDITVNTAKTLSILENKKTRKEAKNEQV